MSASFWIDLWLDVKPIKRFREWRQRRKGKKMAIDLGTRTTTNMTVSGAIVWGVLKLVSTYFPDVPTEGLEELVAAIVAFVIGRLTKTPAVPGVL